MTKILISLLLFLSVVVGLFLFFDRDPTLPIENASSTATLKIAVSPTPLSAPLIVASHNHYFSQLGINVELITCNGGAQCAQMLFDHQVQMATSSESVVMFNSFERNDFSVLTSFVESDNDLKLLSRTHYGIREVSDLIGKKVGVVKSSASEFYLDSLLIINNIPSDTIEKVYLLPTEAIPALFNREVEAISIWEPFGYQAEQKIGANIINLGLPGVYQLSFNLLASQDMAKDKQASIKVLRALNQAVAWIDDNPDLAQTMVSEALSIDPKQLAWSWHDFVFRMALGNSLLSSLQMQARWALNLGLVNGSSPPDFRNYLQIELFEAAIHPED